MKTAKRQPIIKVNIVKEETGYSAFSEVGNNSIFTEGETIDELKANILEAVNLTTDGVA